MAKDRQGRRRRRGALAEARRDPEEEIAALPTEQDRLGTELHRAIAAFFGVELEQLHGFVVACERDDPAKGALTLSTAWSPNTPVWRLESFAREILVALGEKVRGRAPTA